VLLSRYQVPAPAVKNLVLRAALLNLLCPAARSQVYPQVQKVAYPVLQNLLIVLYHPALKALYRPHQNQVYQVARKVPLAVVPRVLYHLAVTAL